MSGVVWTCFEKEHENVLKMLFCNLPGKILEKESHVEGDCF